MFNIMNIFMLLIYISVLIQVVFTLYNFKDNLVLSLDMLRLRCKSEKGTQMITGLSSSSTLQDLSKEIEKITGIVMQYQRILTGYPPKSLDLKDYSCTLSSLSVRSGDTFTVVNKDPSKYASTGEPQRSQAPKSPCVKRMEVPADNSCLFYSVFYVFNGHLEYEPAKDLRKKIAMRVMCDPDRFSTVFLGKTPDEYSAWIQSDTSWGGAIELSILAEIYGTEIAAIDIKTTRLDIYGQDKAYSSRVYLIYDGIHYDPLYFDPCDRQFSGQTLFTVNDDHMLTKVLEFGEEAKRARQFTDTANFSLICLNCQKKLRGQAEAQAHGKETGHKNFSEC